MFNNALKMFLQFFKMTVSEYLNICLLEEEERMRGDEETVSPGEDGAAGLNFAMERHK